jgi:hypothetical protein
MVLKKRVHVEIKLFDMFVMLVCRANNLHTSPLL